MHSIQTPLSPSGGDTGMKRATSFEPKTGVAHLPKPSQNESGKGGIMSDGNEERHESRIREEQERRENLEDKIETDDVDDGGPERSDS